MSEENSKNSVEKLIKELDVASIPKPVVPKERYDLRILSSMRRIIRYVDIYSRKLALEHGVTVPQLLCMLKIDELGPITIKQLSESVFLAPSTIVGIVDRLEKKGVFIRERSIKDRRKVRISLTDAGKLMVEQSPSPLQDTLAASIEKLPELEKATITLSLDRLVSLMDDRCIEEIDSEVTMAPVLETRRKLDTES